MRVTSNNTSPAMRPAAFAPIARVEAHLVLQQFDRLAGSTWGDVPFDSLARHQ